MKTDVMVADSYEYKVQHYLADIDKFMKFQTVISETLENLQKFRLTQLTCKSER